MVKPIIDIFWFSTQAIRLIGLRNTALLYMYMVSSCNVRPRKDRMGRSASVQSGTVTSAYKEMKKVSATSVVMLAVQH